MKNRKKSQEADKYGQITFGEESKLLVDMIGQNVILDLMSKENPESYKSHKRMLERMYKGEIPYNSASLQSYCEKFFKNIESDYKVSPLVMESLNSSLKSFIFDFSLYAESNRILDQSKKEIALYLLQGQVFHYIADSLEKDPLSILLNKDIFKTSEKNVLVFLTDSYKIIFDEIMQIFKNKEKFYGELGTYCEHNNEKYPKLSEKEVINYKQNIINWRNESVYNANWKALVPVLDFLLDKNKKYLVHRLIGLYLRKNAQKTFADILDVSEDELKGIIVKIANMIKGKKRLEQFPSNLYYDNIWFNDQRIKITRCLYFQNNYKNSLDVKKSNNIMEYLKRNYLHFSEEKFLYFWLQTRAKVFEKHSDLKDNKEIQKDILTGYSEAFDEIKETGKNPFLTQFLTETMLINIFFNPRRVKAINDYYEYGCTLEIFRANNEEGILNYVKEFLNQDIRKALVDIHCKFCPIKIS